MIICLFLQSAIAASLDLRSYIHLVRTDEGNVTVELQAIGLKQCWEMSQLQSVAEKNKGLLKSFSIRKLNSHCCR